MQDYSITSQSKGKHLTNQDRLNIERWHNKEGLSNREIAEKLFLSEGSIKQYINQIYSKLHIDGDTRTKRQQLLSLLNANS